MADAAKRLIMRPRRGAVNGYEFFAGRRDRKGAKFCGARKAKRSKYGR